MKELTPWFKPEVINYLSALLKADWTILETGCGGSTIWYAGKVAEVHSFEHDKVWFIKTMNLLREGKIENVYLYYSRNYPKTGVPMKDFPGFGDGNKMFDFISIDGRGRVKSIETTIKNLKSGGYLLLDDSQRERYQQAFVLLNNWESKTFGRDRKQATIWRKPL